MKNYFQFTLAGSKLFPIWILFYLVVIIPYGFIINMAKETTVQTSFNPMFFVLLLIILLGSMALYYFIIKLFINNLKYGERALTFQGQISEYIGKILLGFFLTIITIGIYGPWFMQNIVRFFVNNSKMDDENFEFLGKGGKLFVIILLSVVAPMVIVGVIMGISATSIEANPTNSVFFQVIVLLIMIPYMYLVYKWYVDVRYKENHINWHTDFWSACGKIFIELFLSIITLGIYGPMAYLKLYKYFMDRTYADKEGLSRTFGFDLDAGKDFLFLWGQTLLTIITLAIYAPWAIEKIGKRLINKTYLEEN